MIQYHLYLSIKIKSSSYLRLLLVAVQFFVLWLLSGVFGLFRFVGLVGCREYAKSQS